MRLPHEAGADGPANVLAATRVAATPQSRNRGVLVVINDTIHSPYWLYKSHTVKVETFQSGMIGIVGTILEGKVIYFNDRKFFLQHLIFLKTMIIKLHFSIPLYHLMHN